MKINFYKGILSVVPILVIPYVRVPDENIVKVYRINVYDLCSALTEIPYPSKDITKKQEGEFLQCLEFIRLHEYKESEKSK